MITRTIKWNNRKDRAELDDDAVSEGTARGGPWLEPTNEGFAYQKNRWRPSRPRSRPRSGLVRHLPLGFSLLLLAIPMYGEAKRSGWLPDWEEGLPFPASGSVTVPRTLSMKRVTSSLLVQTSDANTIVQLFDPATGEHVFSVYVRGNDRVRVPVPRGTYEMRLIEGSRWHGPERFFGANTAYETVTQPMLFEHRGGNGIDLRRKVNGGLPTRPMMTDPDKL